MTVCIEYVNTEIRCKEKSMVLEQKNFNLLIIRWGKPEKKRPKYIVFLCYECIYNIRVY